jgi:hypothetical protein
MQPGYEQHFYANNEDYRGAKPKEKGNGHLNFCCLPARMLALNILFSSSQLRFDPLRYYLVP